MTGATLRKMRIDKELTMRQLAKIMGCTEAHISNIENGKRKITRKTQTKIELAFGLPRERTDWSKAIKVSKQTQQVGDFKRVSEMVKEMYDIFKRHGVYK